MVVFHMGFTGFPAVDLETVPCYSAALITLHNGRFKV